MNTNLTAAERLIVAADFNPKDGGQYRTYTYDQVLEFTSVIARTGVVMKVNSALRACGYGLIGDIHDRELQVFVDLKLNDIENTLATDGKLLLKYHPEIVTVMCSTGINALKALKAELPETEILGVTVLTNQTDADTMALYGCSVREAVLRLADIAAKAQIDGLISSPDDLADLRKRFGNTLTYNTPAIRPAWAKVEGDDQNHARVMTPADAIKAGATRIVVGRPITKAPDPREAVLRTLEEIEQALA